VTVASPTRSALSRYRRQPTLSGQSTTIKRIGRNSGWLAGSAAFSAVASLAYIALAARTLGPGGFGTFALVMTFGELLTEVAQFQSWKAITSFGAAYHLAHDEPALSRLFGYTVRLDVLIGIFGAGVALLIAPLIAPLLHWSVQEGHAAGLFGAALLLTSSTSPVGILRLFDRFDLQVLSETIAQLARLTGCLAGWGIGAGVDWFLSVWAIAALLQLVSQVSAVVVLGHLPHLGQGSMRLARTENPGLWSFMLKTNLSSSISMLWMQFGTLAVGARAGAVEAGGFRLAHRFSLAIMKPVEIATKTLFPELARFIAAEDLAAARKLLVRASAVSAAFALLLIVVAGLFGGELLQLVAGPRFRFAQDLLFLLTIAAAINVAGFGLEPFLNAHLRAGSVLRANIIAGLVYAVSLAAMLHRFGAISAALSSIAATLALMVQLCASAVSVGRGRETELLSEAISEREIQKDSDLRKL
jgi:O-antigen/teichoic acid export membrane protein